MSRVLIIPIRFSSVADYVDKRTSDLLKAFGNSIWGVGLEYYVSSVVSLTRPSILPDEDFIEPVINLVEEFPDCTHVIFDFDGPNARREPLDVRVATALSSTIPILNEMCDGITVSAAVGKIPNERDTVSKILNSSILRISGSALLNYSNGKILSLSLNDTDILAAENAISELYLGSQTTNEEMISRTLVCHPGVYKFHDYDKPIYDFYDGSFCGDNIYAAITQKIKSQIKDDEELNVLIDDGGSNWFDIGISNAIIECGSQVTVYPLSSLNDALHKKPTFHLIMVPVLRTGETVGEIFSDLLAAGYTQLPDVFAVVFANAESDSFGIAKHQVEVDGVSFDGPLEVTSLVQRGSRGRLLSRIYLPLQLPSLSIDDILSYPKIPSEAMWSMIFEIGLKKFESEVPDDRIGVSWVPKFEEILEANGVYFASKLKLLHRLLVIDSDVGVNNRNFYFMVPREPAMKKLGHNLRHVFERECVLYVHPDLARLASGCSNSSGVFQAIADNLEFPDDKKENLKRELLGLLDSAAGHLTNNGRSIIALNEFVITGSTIEGMQNLVRILNWKLIATASLARSPGIGFNPPQIVVDADHYLYEFA